MSDFDTPDSTAADQVVVADLSGDGVADVSVELLPDGTYHVLADTDGDSLADEEVVVDRAALDAALPGASDALDELGAVETTPVPDPGFDPAVDDGGIAGDPFGDAEHWFQQAQNGFCAPASVAQIVSEYSGVHFPDESAFVQLASEQGLFSVGMDGVPGMTPENTLTLLEQSGVPAGLEVGTTAELVQYLEEGRGVLLFIDSGEVWEGEAVEDNSFDHAVVLTGIDTERGVAILSDPGSPDGNLEEVPLDVFADAWADSQNLMIVCDEPPAGDPGQETVAAAGEGAPSQIERATSVVIREPWALLPVTLPARS
ncbi:C39 family peptidase [Spirilliplanes yamanashiensis]|uniref:Peptidase C39-like domain-containing protein n=1 Tax=Spirilliplanes yamanashiensis TaxID=42233 RepID=A0A8J3YCT3_9ACTN|nr:C39 family peptidase [Spirilliplanes yamanashiensis]MDP9819090.1 hypothetical protein [Spirilliplanes yamanashiensis]GIJ05544.1 hypothetical protein Sya03_48960 [Spirilliplanes yamanashiensis]